MDKWQKYVDGTKSKPPRKLLINALNICNPVLDNALDLGAGALNDTKFLIESGFKNVTAIDIEKYAEDVYIEWDNDKVTYIDSTFDNYEFPKNNFDLINAQYALPFNPKNTFNKNFEKLKGSLKQNGLFIGQFFGDRDDWNKNDEDMTFHTKNLALEAISDLDIILFQEEEKDEKTLDGNNKHWHIFNIIAKKK